MLRVLGLAAVLRAGLAALAHVERGYQLVAARQFRPVEQFARLVGGHKRPAGGGGESLILGLHRSAQLRVQIRFDVAVRFAHSLGKREVQRLLERHQIRQQLNVPELSLVGADVRVGAGAEADVLRRDLKRERDLFVDFLACVQVGHVHRLKRFADGANLHAVAQRKPCTLAAAALLVVAERLHEIVVILLRLPLHFLRPVDVRGCLRTVLSDFATVFRHRTRLGEQGTENVGHGVAEVQAVDIADVEHDSRIRKAVGTALIAVHAADGHAGEFAETVRGQRVAVCGDATKRVTVTRPVAAERAQPPVLEQHVADERRIEPVAAHARQFARMADKPCQRAVAHFLGVAVRVLPIHLERQGGELAADEVHDHAHRVFAAIHAVHVSGELVVGGPADGLGHRILDGRSLRFRVLHGDGCGAVQQIIQKSHTQPPRSRVSSES